MTTNSKVRGRTALRPFTVLGYSANDEVLCHACLRATTGLHSGDPDYDGRPVLPLYVAEATVREESCTYCGRGLLGLALESTGPLGEAPTKPTVEEFRHQGHPALRFDRRPSPDVLQELKEAGWRWAPVARCWCWRKKLPAVVPRTLGGTVPRREVGPRAPAIRRHRPKRDEPGP